MNRRRDAGLLAMCLGPLVLAACSSDDVGEAMCRTGTNQASSAEGFGLIVSGQASFTSYAYPGGLALEPINPR